MFNLLKKIITAYITISFKNGTKEMGQLLAVDLDNGYFKLVNNSKAEKDLPVYTDELIFHYSEVTTFHIKEAHKDNAFYFKQQSEELEDNYNEDNYSRSEMIEIIYDLYGFGNGIYNDTNITGKALIEKAIGYYKGWNEDNYTDGEIEAILIENKREEER